MSTDEYVPSDDDVYGVWTNYQCFGADDGYGPRGVERAAAEMDRYVARVRRDAAREALDGLYEDASQDYRIGLQGDDQERMDAAEAVLRATYAWMDNYPEETP